MRAKVIADITIVGVLFFIFIWWTLNAPIPKAQEITSISAFIATVISVSCVTAVFAFLIRLGIRWIHKGGEK